MFWASNILAALLLTAFTGLIVLPFVLMSTLSGDMPLSITICLLILISMPIVGVSFAIARPKATLPFFYGVEIPVVLLVALRLSAMREMTLGGVLLVGSAIAACAIFGWHLCKDDYDGDVRPLDTWNPYLRSIAASFLGIVGIFTGVLTVLYAIPIAASTANHLLDVSWSLQHLNPLSVIAIGLYVSTIAAFAAFPFYISYFYPHLWVRVLKTTTLSKTKFVAISIAVAVLMLSAHMSTSSQTHVEHLNALEKMTAAEKRAAMENPERVRSTLVKSYLNEYRFLEGAYSQKLVRYYTRAFGKTDLSTTAQKIQSTLLAPIIYAGTRADSRRADKLYEELFDTPIQRAEQEAVTKALKATYDRDEISAGLMNIGVRNVLLKEQNITLEDRGAYAVVELEEVYENLTKQNQEIFYYFSLPDDAAITGLWIGHTDDRSKMDAFIVAPRGAAQQVYERQVRRNIDPALLEQVGPGQYRLRVFPIPAQRIFQSRRGQTPTPMHMHMRYVVPNNQGKFALPVLLEKRNVDWSWKTKRTFNNESARTSSGWIGRNAVDALEADASALDINLKNFQVKRRSIPDTSAKINGRYAVVIDSSYSMGAQASTLTNSLQELQEWEADSPSVELNYFIHRSDSGLEETEAPQISQVRPYGALTLQQIIAALNERPTSFDAMIILTDQNRYGTHSEREKVELDRPLWIFPQGKAPAAYDDNVLDLIYRSKGGVIDTVSALKNALLYTDERQRVVSGSLWSVSDTDSSYRISPEKSALAARQVILAQSYGTPPTPTELDKLHEIAKAHGVVTPYSSMIVLVNDRQKKQLEEATKGDNRFNRDSRSGKERLSSPSRVSEPSSLLLIILTCLIFWLFRKRKHRGFTPI